MGQVISTINMKDGVGKTTLTVNLAAHLARAHNKRVLIVDLDPQVNATLSLLPPSEFVQVREVNKTLRFLLKLSIERGTATTASIESDFTVPVRNLIVSNVCETQGLDLLPGDFHLYDEFEVSQMLHSRALEASRNSSEEKSSLKTFEQLWNDFAATLIRDILSPVIQDYDFVFIDCAPTYNLLTHSSIIASNFYLIPAKPEHLSVVGIRLLKKRIDKLSQDNPSAKIRLLGIVFTMSGGAGGQYYREVVQRVGDEFESEGVFETEIPNNVDVARAFKTSKPVVLTRSSSSGAMAFAKLTREFLWRLQTLLIKKQIR
ncbi:ParA family protein [Leptolyngbya sp. FACHB-261]|uniref:ParA family protein n=1 Tax=Leptolyngbya sp. FACHB-261 TaxID=2692806 RepID=UPI001689196F|nr:ParA family protein [Leptolyngbya sp. FACHB-261]MBD2099931.1 ParA family protein [Leptolyngbya sp. FACHB-261]